ncbi:hypothetical protein ABZ901_00010 [Actinacidiphila alni]|uniref:hypothetical protein n=1 Tax=Actinacidiphila alni TaxID=380248 RepID=UPI0033DA3E74
MNRAHRRTLAATALLLASAALVSCDSGSGSGTPHAANSGTHTSQKPRPPKPSTTTPSPTPTPTPTAPTAGRTGSTHTLADLVKHPCLAVNEDDTGADKLYVGIEGRESDLGDGPRSCEWGAVGGLVDFAPYPSSDLTTDSRFSGLTHSPVSGHRTRAGSFKDGGVALFVSLGPHASFRLLVTSFGGDAPKGPGSLGLAENFAKAILSHLR